MEILWAETRGRHELGVQGKAAFLPKKIIIRCKPLRIMLAVLCTRHGQKSIERRRHPLPPEVYKGFQKIGTSIFDETLMGPTIDLTSIVNVKLNMHFHPCS